MCPPPCAPRPRRRAVLVGLVTGLTLGVTGCGVDLDELRDVRWDRDAPVPTPTPGPDEIARRRAVEDADALRRSATAAAGTRPELAPTATAVAEAHAAHLDALGASDLAVEVPTPPPVPTDEGPAAPTETGTPTPPTPSPEELPAAETAAAVAALGHLGGTTGGMARLMASVAAADVVHARLLAGALGLAAPGVPSPVTAGTTTDADVGLDDSAARAVTAALEGEHAAVYGYGVVAARLDGRTQDAARGHLAEHRAAADRLADLLRGAGRDVPAPSAAYELPSPAASAEEVRAMALLLEERTSQLHGDAVAAAEDGPRLVAADLLLGAALRAAYWRGSGVPLPGLR